MLDRYVGRDGRRHEVIVQPAHAGSVLVIDRASNTADDARLVAHLGADESAQNAALVCALYLEEVRAGGGGCRRVNREDLKIAPFEDEAQIDRAAAMARYHGAPVDRRGYRYRIESFETGGSIAQLRWCRRASPNAQPRPVSVRELVGRLEAYEPVRTLTRDALARHRASTGSSSTVLRAELRRLQDSPIVLNCRLRAAVLSVVGGQGVSMSEIATRCGRVKVDSHGHLSGETSWLARRLGLLPEAGQRTPTPWIHTDVLALIARDGLGIGPREVEADCDSLRAA